jgi:hypothetical protein
MLCSYFLEHVNDIGMTMPASSGMLIQQVIAGAQALVEGNYRVAPDGENAARPGGIGGP